MSTAPSECAGGRRRGLLGVSRRVCGGTGQAYRTAPGAVREFEHSCRCSARRSCGVGDANAVELTGNSVVAAKGSALAGVGSLGRSS
ncbi:hypothetical protein IG631_07439 [Alternaria alternata]|nr:hypothetical protein IG631_07439 [Alternaria alternata]